MAIHAAERVARLSEMPMFCASCGRQDTEARYVDFDAAWDGPVVNPDDDIKMQIDDLIVCENCLIEASRLVGLVEPDETAQTLARAQEDLIGKEQKITELQRYIERLESAIDAKPGARKPTQPKTKKGPRVSEVIASQPKPAAETSEGVKIIRMNES